jgi:hypothetical protein
MMRTPSLSVMTAALMSLAAIAGTQDAKRETKSPPPSSPSPEASAPPRRGVRPGDVQKVFVLRHLGVNDTARLLSVFPAEIGGMNDGSLRALSVSASPAVVAAIEETLKRLDVPPPPMKNVEITAYVLECVASGDAGTVPQDLQDAVVQLERTFHYSGCALARTVYTRASASGHIHSFKEAAPGLFSLRALIEVDEPSVVRFRSLGLENGAPNQGGSFSGDVEVRDGQKVVLGRFGTASGKDQIVVLTAHVLP